MTRPGSWRRSPFAEMFRRPIAKRFQVLLRQRFRLARSRHDLARGASAEGLEARAIDPVAEPFVRTAVGAKRHANRAEQVGNARARNLRGVRAVQARAVEIARPHPGALYA